MFRFWASSFSSSPASASDDSPDTARAQEIYATLAAELDPSKALQLTSTLTGISRNELYKLLRT